MDYSWQPENIISSNRLAKIAKAYVLREYTWRTLESIGNEIGVNYGTVRNYHMKGCVIDSEPFKRMVEYYKRQLLGGING